MNLKLQKSLKQYGAIFEDRQNLIPATIGTDDTFGQVDVPGKDNYVYVRIQSGEIAQAYNTKVVALAGLRVWCGYEKTRPGLLQVLDVRNVYGKEYQQKVPAHAPTHEYGGYDQVFIRGEQFVPKLVSKYSGMTVRVQAGAIYTDDFGWYWHRPQEISLAPYVPTTGAHWALIEVGYSGTINVKLGSTVESKYLLFENTIPAPSNNAQPVAAVAMYQNQSGINASKYGNNDILDLRWYQAIVTGTAGGGGGIPDAPYDGITYGRNSGTWVEVSGSGGGGSTTLTVDLKIDQTSGTSGYGVLKGNQNGVNRYYTVSNNAYASGRLLVFLNGQALPQGLDWAEQYPASGTFYFITGSNIPISSDIVTAQYTLTTGTGGGGGIPEAPLDGLQYGRQSGTWAVITGSGGGGVTLYSQLDDVYLVSGSPQLGDIPMYYPASGAWINVPIYNDQKDPTGWIFGESMVSYYDNSARTIYLSGTLQYYWRGVKRTLGDGVTWTSSAHSGTDYATYYLYSTDGINFSWNTSPWTFDNMMIALVKRRGSVMFGNRETHGLMPWQVHEALHNSISTFKKSGGDPIPGSYQIDTELNSANKPIFASAVIEDEDLETTIPQTMSGTYTTLRISGSTSIFQAGESFPFRSTGTYILVTDPLTGIETPSGGARWLNIYQIMIPTTADAESQKYSTVFLQPQYDYQSLNEAESEEPSSLELGDFANLFVESVMHSRITYRTRTGDSTIGKCRIASITYVSKFAVGGGGGVPPPSPADYVLSGTGYGLPASVGVDSKYARADHQHGTPPSGTGGGGGGSTTVNNDVRFNQSSGTSVYPNLIGNQNTSNLYFKVSDGQYTSGRLLVFLNGQALSNGLDWAEQFPASGTFYFISGSYIPTSTDIITAQYTISGSLSVADAPMTGLQYGRQSGTWTQISGTGVTVAKYSVDAEIPPTSPSIYDDEFNNGSLDIKWTEFDQNGKLTAIETGTYGALLLSQTYNAGNQLAGMYQTMPTGTNFTVYTKVSLIGMLTNGHDCGIGLWTNAGTGTTSLAFFRVYTASNNFNISASRWNNNGSINNNVFSLSIGWCPTAFLRLRKVGTNYYFAFSTDGIGWIEHPTATVPLAEPRHFGIIVNNSDGTSGNNMSGLFYYFRYLPYAVDVDSLQFGGLSTRTR